MTVTFLQTSIAHNQHDSRGVKTMPKDNRNTIEVLKAELEFVKKGGYETFARDPWRAKLALEDSPTCMNCDHKKNPGPCSECLLMEFVPANKRGEKVPCRHIPLTSYGDTLLHLYQGATEQEIDETLTRWLQETIAKLELNETATEQPSELH
jgi:hypothetical protein